MSPFGPGNSSFAMARTGPVRVARGPSGQVADG